MNTIHATHIGKVLRFVLFSGLLLGASGRAFAQNTPLVEGGGGYQLIRPSGEDAETLGEGWYGEVAYNPNRVVSLVGQVGGNYKSVTGSVTNEGFTVNATGSVHLHEFLGGLRVSDRRSNRVVWF